MKTNELMKALGVSRQTIWKYRKQGMPFKSNRFGCIAFDLDKVKAWLENKK